MLEQLLEKYLKAGKEWLAEEYGTYREKTTLLTIDDEDTPFTHQLIEVAKSHPDIQNSFYETCSGASCLGLEFKGIDTDDDLSSI